MRTLLAAALLVVTSGCLLTPNNGDVLCGANQSVTFSGYAHAPNLTVYLQAAPARTGPFTTITTVATEATGVVYAGNTIYGFSKSAVINSWGSTDATLYTYVRAVIYPTGSFQSPSYLNTFDVTPPSGNNAPQCINNRITAGDSLSQAVAFCASDDSPIAELTAPAVSTCACTPGPHTGNLVIANANQAATYKCITALTGSLTVTDAAPEVVGFPNLTSISGAATLHYERAATLNGNPVYYTRLIQLPVLTSIGGDVALTGRTIEGVSGVPAGLHAVTSVGGDIRLTLYGTNPNVFSGLTHLGGDLLIEGWNGALGNLDLGAGSTLANLKTVGGDVHVRGFFSTNSVLNNLDAVGGNLTVEAVRFYPSVSFASLDSVGGNLHFRSMKLMGPPWGQLDTVGGELGVFGHNNITNLSSLPVSGFTAAGLRVENNSTLTGLGVNVQLGGGAINIHGNPALSQCTVNSFVAAQVSGGFSGSTSVTGTVPCP